MHHLSVRVSQTMAQRESVRRCVERQASEFYRAFAADINAVKKHLDGLRRAPPRSAINPRYAGTAK